MELLRGAWPLGEVLERKSQRAKCLPSGRALRRSGKPPAGARTDGQFAKLTNDTPLGERNDFLFGQHPRHSPDKVPHRLAEAGHVPRIAQKVETHWLGATLSRRREITSGESH